MIKINFFLRSDYEYWVALWLISIVYICFRYLKGHGIWNALFERAFNCFAYIVALSATECRLPWRGQPPGSLRPCQATALANIDKTFALLCPLPSCWAAELLSCNAPFAYLKLQISQYQIECKQKHRGKRAIQFDSTLFDSARLDSTRFRLQLGGAIQFRCTSVEIRMRIDSELAAAGIRH